MSSEPEFSSPELSTLKKRDPEMLARLYIREGKSFKESALASGYGKSTASKGIGFLAGQSSAVALAVERENTRLSAQLDNLTTLKPLAIRRLHAEITDLKRPGGLKAIEIAGRFKETDWFVRSVDVQVGVFASFADSPADPASEALEAYKATDSEE